MSWAREYRAQFEAGNRAAVHDALAKYDRVSMIRDACDGCRREAAAGSAELLRALDVEPRAS